MSRVKMRLSNGVEYLSLLQYLSPVFLDRAPVEALLAVILSREVDVVTLN